MLVLHRAERADQLTLALRDVVATPLSDVFAPEIVAVPTRGMERWITQRLSHGYGDAATAVCANVDFSAPRAIVDGAVAAATGSESDDDPWYPARAVWPLMALTHECIGEPWLATLAAHLGGPDDPDPIRRARRFASLRHIAGLYDRYSLERPEMLRAWATGEDVDGSGAPLIAAAAWQAELWRRLRARIGGADPAERVMHACERLRSEPGLADLPERLSLFGLTRLPPTHLEVFTALAEHRDVHLFLLHPSPDLWSRARDALRGAPATERRAEDPTAHLPRNRLLASWGRDARELQVVVSRAGESRDHHHDGEPGDDRLLARLQTAIRDDAPPPLLPHEGQPDPRPRLDPEDRSVQVHACHGRARQVEILRDQILHLLDEDETLEPRDVIVMCPDIETFAPLIHATFGAGDNLVEDEADAEPLPPEARPPDLRVRLADRALRQTNAVLGVLDHVLELAQSRMTASQVLDLADRAPVRRRFRFDDDDLARLQDWVADAGIRWGLDASHRAAYQLSSLDAGTWRAGLDRVLVGVAMSEEEDALFTGVLPLDDVESGSIDLAGRVSELLARLEDAVDALRDAKTIDDWVQALADAADALAATAPREEWQRAQLQRILDAVVEEAAGSDIELSLPEVRSLLADRLQGRPTRANFRTGHLTVCTLHPMRSVPHRVVCLLGLDDGAFPRAAPRDGDDLILADPHIGDRDPRSEDRQMLLDALMAAGDRLIVTYTGNDERTNTPKPPAVPVGELLDTIDRTVRADAGRPRDQVLVRHPLQPFDPEAFAPGALTPGKPWSYDRVTLEGARKLLAERAPSGPFVAEPLSPHHAQVLDLRDLVSFVEHPVRAFLRQRLGISVREYSDEVADALPVALDGLERYAVGQQLLESCLDGSELVAAIQAERARGTLPPGVLADEALADATPAVSRIVALAQAATPDGEQARSQDIRVELSDGRTLSGTVAGLHGSLLRHATFATLAPKHRLAAWARYLALTAALPEIPWHTLTLGRRWNRISKATIAPLPGAAEERRAAALAQLEILADLHARGMREPLPIYGATSAAYAVAALNDRDFDRVSKEWTTFPWDFPKEDVEEEHKLVLGGVVAYERLLETAPRPDETWEADQPTRFGRCAVRLWRGLLTHERVESA